jgi:hypothetical protein
MKIFAISDLHLSVNNPKPMDIFGPVWEGYLDKIFTQWREKVGEDDIVLLPGDFSWAMKLEDTKKDFELLAPLPGKKILIRGNHDYWWKSISAVRSVLPQNFYAIQNDAIKFENVVFCGTRGWPLPDKSYTEDDEKIFRRELLRLEMTLSEAKKMQNDGDKLVCIMHYPPVNFAHEDSEFSQLIEKYNVDIVVYGHLHGYSGVQTYFEKNGVKYFLTSCDLVNNNLISIL